jgi:hypothetical protein
VEVVIEYVVEDGIECSAFLGRMTTPRSSSGTSMTRETNPATPPGVADEFTAVVVAQSPAQSVIGEVGFQCSETWRRSLMGRMVCGDHISWTVVR